MQDNNNSYEKLIEKDVKTLLGILVDDPDLLDIKVIKMTNRTAVEIHAGEQSKYLIGRQGCNIAHIRHIIYMIGNRYKKLHGSEFVKIEVDVIDDRRETEENKN